MEAETRKQRIKSNRQKQWIKLNVTHKKAPTTNARSYNYESGFRLSFFILFLVFKMIFLLTPFFLLK